jgi:hypothetical protein
MPICSAMSLILSTFCSFDSRSISPAMIESHLSKSCPSSGVVPAASWEVRETDSTSRAVAFAQVSAMFGIVASEFILKAPFLM